MNKKGEPTGISVIPTGGCHDCGGRCPFKVHVKNGVAIRLESDVGPEEPQLRACARGRAYRKRVYDPNRLKYPMKQIGARGEGKFERISWDEALDTVARELKRVKETYGPSAILGHDHSGDQASTVLGRMNSLARFLNMFGGFTRVWGSASRESGTFATRCVYGTERTANTRDDLVNSRLIIMWAWNPACTIQDTGTSFHLVKAKEAGARIIYIDPRFTDSAIWADQWIPIRPGTDAAMMAAMAYVVITENLQDQKFLDKYTVGFDKFKGYVIGTEDGVPKTPTWAETITAVPSVIIENLAREYATSKPAALIPGWGPGRTAYGEEYHRAAATLAAMTGNIGIHGGNAAGLGGGPLGISRFPSIPQGENPLEVGVLSQRGFYSAEQRNHSQLHASRLWDAILKGKAGGYPSDIKLAYIICSNTLNQWLNINKGIQALQKLEFIVVHEQFMTPTAKFADILLPANTIWERTDFSRPWLGGMGPYYIYMNQVIDSMYESKQDFDIFSELAIRLGFNYTDKTKGEWIEETFKKTGDMSQEITDYEAFKRDGVYKIKLTEPKVCFQKNIEDPEHNPFPTPSGKIEIYSQRLAELNDPKLPAVPKYIETWESINDLLAKRYPLQLITPHHKFRAHSCFDNVPWLKELEAQVVWLNSGDAKARGISDGDEVKVFNDRGIVILPAKVTERIMPGVTSIPEGAWYRPDQTGTDRGGCPNTLTNDRYSPGGAWAVNTSLVQIEKV